MSINPDSERWKRRFVLCLLFTLGALFLTGAREANEGFHLRPARRAAVSRHWQSLASSLIGDRPVLEHPRAAELDDADAVWLIQVCSRPISGGP